MATYSTTQHAQEVLFDAGFINDFDTVGSIGASVVQNTVQAILPLAQDCKIYKVGVSYTALTNSSGTQSFNIVVGTGTTYTGAGSTDTVATAGTQVFATNQTITPANAGNVQILYPTNFDVIYGSSQPNFSPAIVAPILTLRVVTGLGDSITNLKVIIFTKCINQHGGATYDPTPLGNYSFDPSVF